MQPRTILLALTLLSCCGMAIAQKRKLVWWEEFNYTGQPDSSKWNYETGHIRNNEKQYYTKARLENARVENGLLIIEAKKESYPNNFHDRTRTNWKYRDSLAAYTSASITTQHKRHFKYGRVEVRAKLPQGKGVWPAIWMLGSTGTWPWRGEIDIMEFVGHDSNHIHASLHYPIDSLENMASQGGELEVKNPYNGFHVYAMEWNKKRIQYYFDDSLYHKADVGKTMLQGSSPFHKPFYLIINLALGGSWGGDIDNSILPQQLLVDYVRVYR